MPSVSCDPPLPPWPDFTFEEAYALQEKNKWEKHYQRLKEEREKKKKQPSKPSPIPSPAPPSRRTPPSAQTDASSPSPSMASPRSDSEVFLHLFAFRIANALVVRTFFQPDEFFQALEPAWKLAFGENQGPWITWEWTHQLRSSLHPLIFAIVLFLADSLSRAAHLLPTWRAHLLIAAPGIAQAAIAAAGDFYTWKLARRIYRDKSYESWATLALTIISPWQWFCSTRTLSNCLETTLTIVALYLWPWECSEFSTLAPDHQGINIFTALYTWPRDRLLNLLRTPPNFAAIQNVSAGDIAGWIHSQFRAAAETLTSTSIKGVDVIRLRLCLSLIAIACILRPTNVIIWIVLAGFALYRSAWRERVILAREALLCGLSILALSFLFDRFFYGFWTFPPLHFWHFNVVQSLAIFYGRNDWSYYATQGYIQLLTTALVFTLVGLYRTLRNLPWRVKGKDSILIQLAYISLAMPVLLSAVTHKEVRFIYPVLPALHILSAPPLVEFCLPAIETSETLFTFRRLALSFLFLLNIALAFYTTVMHNSGVISVLSYLRDQHQIHGTTSTWSIPGQGASYGGITAGFLMPCHSTPWRSHLVEPTIHAWALTCEPPIDLSPKEKAEYLDEADQFYDNPVTFLRHNMVGGLRHIPRRPSYATPPSSKRPPTQLYPPHEWPDYLVFYAQLEPTLKRLLQLSSYGECWRTFNTHWHDDYRRVGDVVVWCLDHTEQQKWRSRNEKQALATRNRQFDRIIKSFRRPSVWEQYKAMFTGLFSFDYKSWYSANQPWYSSWGLPQTYGWKWKWPWAQRPSLFGIPLPRWSDLTFWRRNIWDDIWF
ncbi:Alg9-like mannosyltransferase family-domain-containing protein [Aspergillus karnatakaensis]|uniref:putative glycosylphosphatidylinositol-alpha 1,2 mannosyltransferase n=1 Tax=Aspergillus karnatakaensis TaxID=1810916 RepID=UPI003CCCC1D5